MAKDFEGSLAEISEPHTSRDHPYEHVDVYHIDPTTGKTKPFRDGLRIDDK